MPFAADIYYHIFEGEEAGRRPPVVLIHGAGGNHLYWPSQVRRLPGYRVYALDLPGHGKSGGRGQQTISAYTANIIEWMEAVGLYSAVFIGHSMGSGIALDLALNQAAHVLGLGLLGSAARLLVNPVLIESSASPTTFHTAVDNVVNWSFSPATPEHLIELAARRMAETRPSVLHADFLACNGFDLSDRVDQITQPAVVICGAEDHMTPLRHAQFLAAAIPNARLVLIPDAGHMVMLEQPELVAQTLSAFLSDIVF